MTLLHMALGTPQMAEELAALGRDNFGALRDLTILWLLLMVSLFALARLAWVMLERCRFPDLADVLKALGLGVALVLGIASIARIVILSQIVGQKLGLAGYEIGFAHAIVLAVICAAVLSSARWYNGRREGETNRGLD